jgi:hypothetical protein
VRNRRVRNALLVVATCILAILALAYVGRNFDPPHDTGEHSFTIISAPPAEPPLPRPLPSLSRNVLEDARTTQTVLTGYGLTPTQARAIAGCLIQESRLNPAVAVNQGTLKGYGIAFWNPEAQPTEPLRRLFQTLPT